MEENKKIILPSERYFRAPEEDLSLKLTLENNDSLLREGDINIVIDQAELYNKERNLSKDYKIHGKIKMVFKNMYTGNTSYTYLKDRLHLVGEGNVVGVNEWAGYMPYNEFAFLRNDVVREMNITQTGSTLGTFTPNITVTTGFTGHTIVTPITAPYQNWNLYLTYVYSGDTTFPMHYTLSGNTYIENVNYASFSAGDGIPFRVTDNGTHWRFTSPVEHGISAGEYLIISGKTLNDPTNVSGRTFYVDSIGSEVHNSENYVIDILKNQFVSGTTLSTMGNIIVGKRCISKNNISGTTSSYYVHKHKTLTTVNDYIMDNIGFESPIWRDEKKLVYENFSRDNDVLVQRNRMESVLFDFKENFTLSGITNNLGYTPTDLYVTVLFRNGNGFFKYPPKVGYKFNFHDSWTDKHFDGVGTNESSMTSTAFTKNDSYTGQPFAFNSGNTLSKDVTLTGAFVEYNRADFKERIISEAVHKFTAPTTSFDYGQTGNVTNFSGSTLTNPFGYYYQPHYRIKLRQLSPYVETARTNDILNLPENTVFDPIDKVWKWRDLYDHGYVDMDGYGTDFPFVNDTHYVRADINFYLRNEQYYNNKKDGITDFNNKNLDLIC